MFNLLRLVPESLVKLDNTVPINEFRTAKFQAFGSLFVVDQKYTKKEIVDILTANGFPCPQLFICGYVEDKALWAAPRIRKYFNKIKFSNGKVVYKFSSDMFDRGVHGY